MTTENTFFVLLLHCKLKNKTTNLFLYHYDESYNLITSRYRLLLFLIETVEDLNEKLQEFLNNGQ